MKNIKILLITSIVSIISTISITSLFASNVGRYVYGIYTETYKGANSYAISDNVGDDDDALKLYIWNGGSLAPSEPPDSDAVEGNVFQRFTIKGTSWNVAAYAPVKNVDTIAPKKMEDYFGGSIKFLARSENSSLETATVGFQCRLNNGQEVLVLKRLKDLAFTANGSWQEITIHLTTSTTFITRIGSTDTQKKIDSSYLDNVIALFIFRPVNMNSGHSIDIDNVRWVRKEEKGSFSADLKNISGDTTATTITWDESVFRQGWKVANQYVQLDLDKDLPMAYLKTWKVKIYTVGGTKIKNGLRPYRNDVLDTGSPNLSLCWRMIDVPLLTTPSPSEHTTIIDGFYDSYNGLHLYDAGRAGGVPDWWCWLLIKDQTDDLTDDYSTIWDWRGWHAAENGLDDEKNPPFYNGAKVSPRLYLGADFANASDFVYRANIKIEFFNE